MIEIERNKGVHRNLSITIVVALYFIVRSTINNFSSETEWRNYVAILLLFLIAFLILILVNSLSEFFKTKPALIINRDGIEDNISFSESGFIGWKNIESVELGRLKGNDHLIIKLHKDYEANVNSLRAKRMLLDEIKTKFGNAIAINKDYVKGDLKNIMQQIVKKKREHKTTQNNIGRGIANPDNFSTN